MKKATKKYLLIASILLMITGLAIGFAAFSNTLTISSSATVTPQSSNSSVKFSSSGTELETNEIEPITCDDGDNCSFDTITEITATNAIINNSGNPTLTGRKVSFTKPGQWAEYVVYIRNDGEYDAYLNEIKFNNVSGKDSPIVCTAEEGTSQSLVDEACKGIYYSTHFVDEGEEWTATTTLAYNIKLSKGESFEFLFPITYLEDSVEADGPFKVEFGDIELVWSTVPNE